MPRLHVNQVAHQAEAQQITNQALGAVSTADGRVGVGYARDLVASQARSLEPLAKLGQMPFASGMLMSGIPLPGIRGRVRSISGTSLTLWDVNDQVNFTGGLRVQASATEPTTGAVRSGDASIVASVGGTGVLLASTNWTTAIPALAVGDFLYGFGEYEAPTPLLDANGQMMGEWIGARQVRIQHHGGRSSLNMNQVSGYFVLQNNGSQPAQLWTLHNGNDLLILGSKYASPGVDLWLF